MNKQWWVLGGLFVLLQSSAAWAYVGPGAGLSAIGSLLALVVAILVAIIGFVWYPVKRLLKRRQEPTLDEAAEPEEAAEKSQSAQKSQADNVEK